MDRQAEMEYLEKQKLLMEIAMLKAENNSLHEKLKVIKLNMSSVIFLI